MSTHILDISGMPRAYWPSFWPGDMPTQIGLIIPGRHEMDIDVDESSLGAAAARIRSAYRVAAKLRGSEVSDTLPPGISNSGLEWLVSCGAVVEPKPAPVEG